MKKILVVLLLVITFVVLGVYFYTHPLKKEVYLSSWISVETDISQQQSGRLSDREISIDNWVTYKIDTGEVFYNNNWSTGNHSSAFTPVSQADAATFLVLENNDWYAKDKNNIYLYGKIFPACPDVACKQNTVLDPNTFSIVPLDAVGNLFQYVKDKNGVYYEDFYGGNNLKWVLLKNADPETFVAFWLSNKGYGKDKNTVWFGDQIVVGADASTFTATDTRGEDAKRSYYLGKVIPN